MGETEGGGGAEVKPIKKREKWKQICVTRKMEHKRI